MVSVAGVVGLLSNTLSLMVGVGWLGLSLVSGLMDLSLSVEFKSMSRLGSRENSECETFSSA